MRKSIKLPEGRDFKGIWISAERYLDTNLSLIEIIILSEVESFQKRGECYASNQHFADFLGVSENRIKHIIPDLVERGYLDSVSVFNQEKQKKERKLSISDRHLYQSAKNSTYHSAKNDTLGSAKNDTISITDIKYNNSEDKVSKVNFTEHQGEENPHMPDVGYFDHVDIHNDFILADVLKKMLRSYNIDETMRAYKHPYILLSTFAETYREKKHRKHDEIHYSKLQEYVGRLVKFTPVVVADDGISNTTPKNHHFSIFDYTEDEIRMMVDDFFNYDFSDADYSLHLFMSNDVLEARFWQIENRRTNIAI